MSFISYAQNFEDVILWRALKHVKNGFYIDVGAQHPIVDSVSLSFYENGWRGVHIEPTYQYSELLRAERPDETVYKVAIGNRSEPLKLYQFHDTGLSTADEEIAQRHIKSGFNYTEALVPVLSLDALLQQVGVREIHWLKIDVEGLEKEVLDSWMDSSFLPWIVVVESTKPLTQEESYDIWELQLKNKGYSFAYFDGLNRFYLSPQHLELADAFKLPPNIFDEFVFSGTASHTFENLMKVKIQQAEAKAQQAEARELQADINAQQARELAQSLHQHIQNLENTLNDLYASRSWRFTVFFRKFKELIMRWFK